MSFAHPYALLGIFLVLLFFFYMKYDQRKRESDFDKTINRRLWKILVPRYSRGSRSKKIVYWTLAICLIFISLAQPRFGFKEESIPVNGLDLVIALDLSNSMLVEDVVPSRLKKAKHVIRALTSELSGDRVGLVGFAGSAFLASPLTTDLRYLVETVDSLSPDAIDTQGTDIGLAIETATKALERGAETELVQATDHDDITKAILLISDGEDLEKLALEGGTYAKERGIFLFIMGVGTEKGGPIPLRNRQGVLTHYKKDSTGASVVSRFDPSALQKLANHVGGKYWTITPAETEVSEFLKEVGALNRNVFSEKKIRTYFERFQIPLAFAIFFLILDLFVSIRSKAVVIFVFLSPFLSIASELDVYLSNEKAIEYFSKGKIDKAKDFLGEAQSMNPNSKELKFNQGIIEREKGDLDRSIEAFSDAAKFAIDAKDFSLAGRALYNLGSTLEKKVERDKKENLSSSEELKNDTNQAIRSYLQSLDIAKKNEDKELEDELRKKIHRMIEKKKQQKQKEKNQKKDSQKNKSQEKKKEDQKSSQDKKDQEGKGQNKDEKEKERGSENDKKEEKKSENEKFKKNKNKKFKSEKLNEEDAKKVMSELSNRERDLQKKFLQRSARKQKSIIGKDW
ncbi:MAG: hypothetical protein CL678_10755 [Bdellovibrionaceae bacterium]|nr:hypothetical protein [Pseudobdellovibrionaceae bacterium]|tara:strand:- start:1526 stop:3403 length:1878 start_codon:yes stop_codon:yes gene_type:complete